MRNTLILADQIEHDLASGVTMRQAIVESTVRRARPVILTALAAVLAFVPLTFNIFWGPMAISMIGGLTVATVLTLVFMPALYALWFRRRLDKSDAELESTPTAGEGTQAESDKAEQKTDPAPALPQAAE
jgi:Cu/Ag efflux pump CusA